MTPLRKWKKARRRARRRAAHLRLKRERFEAFLIQNANEKYGVDLPPHVATAILDLVEAYHLRLCQKDRKLRKLATKEARLFSI